jgi:membrane associated rhomboid family serine protease
LLETPTALDSNNSKMRESLPAEPRQASSWIKVGAVAAASALAGGLAAAWFYRRTLRRMQAAELEAKDSNFRTKEGPEDEI